MIAAFDMEPYQNHETDDTTFIQSGIKGKLIKKTTNTLFLEKLKIKQFW